MSIQIATTEPTRFAAGETVKFKRSFSDFPATTWTLTYYIRGDDSLDVVAAASGNEFLVTFSATDTALLRAGTYTWEARVSYSGEVAVVDRGTFTVDANIETASAGEDLRSLARRVLSRIENVLLNRATRDDISYTLPGAGMSLGRMGADELLRWYNYWKARVDEEEIEEAAASGKPAGNQVRIKFSRPS